MERNVARFRSLFGSFSKALSWVGGAVLIFITVYTFINIIVRPISGSLMGVTEVISYAFVIVVCSGFAYCAIRRGNVEVDILVSRLSPRWQAISDIVGNIIGIGIFAVIAWQAWVNAIRQAALNEIASVLEFSIIPFRYMLVAGAILLCVALLFNLLESVAKVVKK
jgi:TRAP-type C4-dicarboxylate transport system permease small subunit